VDLQKSLSHLLASSPLPFPVCANESIAECVKASLETIRDGNYRLGTLLAWMQKEIGNDGEKLCSLFGLAHKLYELDALKDYGTVIREACETYAWSSSFSDCGQRMPWIDTEANAICTLELSARDFPEGFPEKDYWRRQIWDLPYELGKTIAAKDVPIDPRRFVEQQAVFPRAENVEEARRHTLQLLDDAVCNKKWTIPWGAIVQLKIGPFTHIEVFEIAENVFFVLRTAEGEISTAAVSPQQRWCVVAFPHGLTEHDKVIEAAVSLLLSAVVRDFWVVEEREATFSHSTEPRAPWQAPTGGDKPRVVYLARIRYRRQPDVRAAAGNLGYAERQIHPVAAHLRRTTSASEQQLILAKRYGFDVPEGFTFVRPHERGKWKRDVIYRSRSALQSLFSATEVGEASGRVRWFQFERDVRDLMSCLGFDVEHVAASRHGDGGVDVYATKGADLDRVNWLIQCKCFHPRRRIGPSTIRELEGVLNDYPRGTRGMIVATCCFSTGAKERARTADIRLVDGNEFMQLTTSVRERATNSAAVVDVAPDAQDDASPSGS